MILAKAGNHLTDQAKEQTGSLATALAHTAKLLAERPMLAEAQAREILKAVPHHPQAELLLAQSLRAQDRTGEARAILDVLAASQPKHAGVQFEHGLASAELGDSKAAIAALLRAVALDPDLSRAWLVLGDQLKLAGDDAGADKAYAEQIRASTKDPELLEAAKALAGNRLAIAERLLRDFLKRYPTDVAAMRMLAETGTRLGRFADAETLLARALALAPSFTAARNNYAVVLHRQNKEKEALAQVELLLAETPRHGGYRALKAAILGQIGDYAEAIALYQTLLKDFPDQPKAWMSYGHALKAVGRQDESIAAYRRSVALLPSLGEAYWSLANLKTFRFGSAEIDAMRHALGETKLGDEDRLHLHFALGKALEDEGRYAESFEHYAKGNVIRLAGAPYDADATSRHVARSKVLFTADFLRARQGYGTDAPDPIFIVGLPRAGSTLIEQILASHSAVEGTMELPDVIAISRRLGGRKRNEESKYPEILAGLDSEAIRALGEEYLARTRIQRKLGRPFFIDKMPNNFQHVGLIHLMLPNAKVIDARRHPLGCCFSGFKQHFARGQSFTYSLADIGRYYADYVALMAHFDAVLPGRVHRVLYERMVEDPEREVRKLLAYCGLPFEDACLKFYETDRAVRTASSEQVRQPIFTEGVDHWRNFEPWLGPLKEALGPVLDSYPDAPSV